MEDNEALLVRITASAANVRLGQLHGNEPASMQPVPRSEPAAAQKSSGGALCPSSPSNPQSG